MFVMLHRFPLDRQNEFTCPLNRFSGTMRIEYNRAACTGWFQCVQEWDEFEMDMSAAKAVLSGAEETDDDVFVRAVPPEKEEEASEAAEACPVDAITVYDSDGEQLFP